MGSVITELEYPRGHLCKLACVSDPTGNPTLKATTTGALRPCRAIKSSALLHSVVFSGKTLHVLGCLLGGEISFAQLLGISITYPLKIARSPFSRGFPAYGITR